MRKPYYIFDPKTGEYSGIYEAQESPLEEGMYIAPVNSTDIAPPQSGFAQIAVFANGAWIIFPDHRGETWYDSTGNQVAITAIGAPPSTLSSSIPAAVAFVQAQDAQIALLAAAYQTAIQQPVVYTSKGGVAKTFQSDQGSVFNLQAAIAGCMASQATPTGFYWLAADNTQVPFTFFDLTALASEMFFQGDAAFQHLQVLKSAVRAAATIASVQAIVW